MKIQPITIVLVGSEIAGNKISTQGIGAFRSIHHLQPPLPAATVDYALIIRPRCKFYFPPVGKPKNQKGPLTSRNK